jgi:hypothetical protein
LLLAHSLQEDDSMSIVTLVLVLVVLGFCLWLLLTFVPMPALVRQMILAFVAIAVVLWVLDATGIYSQKWFHL